MTNTTKYFLYARKSTDDDDYQVYSIEHQLAEVRDLVCRRDLTVVAEFVERRSAKEPGRPVFNEMLARIKKGEASGIISWSPDRLARNPIDGGHVLHRLDRKVLSDLKFPTHHFEASAAGKLMLAVLFGVSKYHNDTLSEGLQRSYLRRAQDGRWSLRLPLGYAFVKKTRTVVPDPRRAPLVRKAFELYATGEYTLEQLRDAVNALGLRGRRNKHHPPRPVSRTQYHSMLQHPFYVGIIRLKGELYEGKHPPLIPVRLFDACQTLLAQKGRRQVPHHKPFLYRHMFTCGECGCGVTMEVQKGITYLRCTKRKGPCSQPYLRQDELQRQLEAAVRRFAVPEAFIGELLAYVQARQGREADARREEIRRARSKVDAAEAKMQRLNDLYIDGQSGLGLTAYAARKERLLKEKRKCSEILDVLTKDENARFEPVLRFIRGLAEPQAVAASGDAVRVRDFFRKVGSNLKIESGRVSWSARGAWEYVDGLGSPATRKAPAPVRGAGADQTIPVLCPRPSAARTLGDHLRGFFKDDPAWT